MEPMLRLYNTLTREKAPFAPIDPTHVRMYACGPTVYDAAHIGNARPIIVFDLLFRLLRHRYGAAHVTYARNVTDVDDKINARAAERGVTIRALTDGTLGAFHDDLRKLGVLMPEDVNVPGERPRFVEPRATDHIAEMVAIVERLVASGHAYVAEDHVLFDVPAMADYGALSKRPLDEMEAGARVEVAAYKRSTLDFVLWKPSKPGEPSWPSPCGIALPGRPGWHIECSAMSWKHLGETFDIHAGGIDLIFPHHENEVAQSRCCFSTPVMAHVWLHNGFLQVEGQKMSKSLGNFVTLRDVLKDWPGEVVRLAMLKTHYRQPIDWTLRGLEEASRMLERWYGLAGDIGPGRSVPATVLEPLLDDLNTAAALAELHRLDDPADLKAGAGLFGLLGSTRSQREAAAVAVAGVDVGQVEALIEERRAARLAKNWAESDRIRDRLLRIGVAVKDNKDGTATWTVAT
ncbi:cysteine--tRNA ligase [uncultured Methylobacterium sp.]|uniref:cysteine--tRNA ligase n=1 Tax=uncultured Methylobacterium sp. TaxID=157278 RepID=UPI0035CBB2F8